MSNNAKVGIGCGVGGFALAIAAIVGGLIWARRRARNDPNAVEMVKMPTPYSEKPLFAFTPRPLNDGHPQEMMNSTMDDPLDQQRKNIPELYG
jgi:hypothetical protein